MKIQFHGHACVQITTNSGHNIIIDPFITGNPLTAISWEDIKTDYIILSHAHEDHVGDTVAIAKANDATVIAMVELAEFIGEEGIKIHSLGIGGSYRFPFGTVKLTQAWHSSSYQGKNYGLASGIILDDGHHSIYHAGDTALFSDMSLVPAIDIAFLPIGDNYTMGIADALKACQLIEAHYYVPIHFNTFPLIKQNPKTFIENVPAKRGLLLNLGDIFTL